MSYNSPFFPGRPVSSIYFRGRKKEIKILDRKIKQSLSGSAKYILIKGVRGIGKTSLAHYIMKSAQNSLGAFTVYVSIAQLSDLEDVILKIIEQLGDDFSNTMGLKDKFTKFFGNKIFEIQSPDVLGLPKVSIQEDNLKNYINPRNFSSFIGEFCKNLQKDPIWNGFILVVDDINGIAKDPLFSGLLKSLADELQFRFENINFALMLCSTEDKWENVKKGHESVQRIFDHIELTPMTNLDVKIFYEKAFAIIGKSIENDALKQMVDVTNGYPALVQELGEAVFFADIDNKIDLEDYFNGLDEAIEATGRKNLTKIIREVKSDKYKVIFKSIADNLTTTVFEKKELRDWLKDLDVTDYNITEFLRKFKNLNVIASGISPGKYYFPNAFTLLYIYYAYEKKDRYFVS
jgi:hypothetical protein